VGKGRAYSITSPEGKKKGRFNTAEEEGKKSDLRKEMAHGERGMASCRKKVGKSHNTQGKGEALWELERKKVRLCSKNDICKRRKQGIRTTW